MAYVYVYAPFSGEIWGKQTYCNGTAHTIVNNMGGNQPMDIGDVSAGTSIRFKASSSVKSIRTRRADVCATQTGDWDQGVIVDMYAELNAQCYIGSVSYGHVRNWVANGTHNTRTLTLGVLPTDCNCGCSDGVHVHTQCDGGTITGLAQCAGSRVYNGSTWIYRWYWNPGWC
ncbi:hypothetical protein SCOR_29945 [Sulfidibacter corallicola]|uniref:Uncharacterized protein n=1 Tax=Sulfidibacter corallicola TaxID=2818388 RepID=A0A8A4TM82_SULCO|nr:hypothetical protein [Sulfidibacter corallicola]QTD50222.1 hypothetical protein J3U87_31945 [Sulfidibacter corallicola]